MADLGGLSTTGIDIVVTASCESLATHATGSWGDVMSDNVANQSATATVGGFTNTLAASQLLTVATSSTNGATFTITNTFLGGVTDATTTAAAATGSIATTTLGNDTYVNSDGSQTFDGSIRPYTFMPRKQ